MDIFLHSKKTSWICFHKQSNTKKAGMTVILSPQAEKLYQLMIDAANLTGEETVVDAYCGIGTITMALAKKAK